MEIRNLFYNAGSKWPTYGTLYTEKEQKADLKK